MSNQIQQLETRISSWEQSAVRSLANSLSGAVENSDDFLRFVGLAYLVLMTAVACMKARYQMLWLDEIISVFVAKQPHFSNVLKILATGADGQPPFYHFVTRMSLRVLRNDALGVRIPSVIAFVVFSICAYLFVARRCGRPWGLLAMIFPSVTGCWYYATEGRPYALVLACISLAAVCWQSVAMNLRRVRSLIGMFLSLAAAMNFHYFSVLLVVPLGIAECVRSLERRKVDVPVWAALVCSGLTLLPNLPLMLESKRQIGTYIHEFQPGWFYSLSTFSDQFLSPSLVVLAGIGCIYLAWQAFMSASGKDYHTVWLAKISMPEVALAVSLTCLPLMDVAFAKVATHVLFTRYSIASILGIAMLLSFALWLGSRGRREPVLGAIVLVCFWFVHVAFSDLRALRDARAISQRQTVRKLLPASALAADLPIAVPDPDLFMKLSYYSDPGLAKRIVYVSSKAVSDEIKGATFLEQIMIASAPYFGTNVIDYYQFVKESPKFYLLRRPTEGDWLTPRLLIDKSRMLLLQGGSADHLDHQAPLCFLVQHDSSD